MRAALLALTLLAMAVPVVASAEPASSAAKELHQLFESEWERGLREFRDLVLGSGAVPFDVLEANVAAWQARKAAAP